MTHNLRPYNFKDEKIEHRPEIQKVLMIGHILSFIIVSPPAVRNITPEMSYIMSFVIIVKSFKGHLRDI